MALVGCSSGDDSATAGAGDASTEPDGAVASRDAAAASDAAPAALDGGAAPPPDGAPPPDAAATGPTACSYSVSGDRTEPSTNAVIGCANGRVQQPNGKGDFTFLGNAAFQTSAGESFIFTCSLSSPTAPAAGSVWSMTTDGTTQGNCEFDASKGSTANIWKAVGNTATATGAAKITFASATMVHGTYHPENVYYLYDVTIEATLKGQTAGATEVKVTAHFKNGALPLGS